MSTFCWRLPNCEDWCCCLCSHALIYPHLQYDDNRQHLTKSNLMPFSGRFSFLSFTAWISWLSPFLFDVLIHRNLHSGFRTAFSSWMNLSILSPLIYLLRTVQVPSTFTQPLSCETMKHSSTRHAQIHVAGSNISTNGTQFQRQQRDLLESRVDVFVTFRQLNFTVQSSSVGSRWTRKYSLKFQLFLCVPLFSQELTRATMRHETLIDNREK